jgi:hypothetical protein
VGERDELGPGAEQAPDLFYARLRFLSGDRGGLDGDVESLARSIKRVQRTWVLDVRRHRFISGLPVHTERCKIHALGRVVGEGDLFGFASDQSGDRRPSTCFQFTHALASLSTKSRRVTLLLNFRRHRVGDDDRHGT